KTLSHPHPLESGVRQVLYNPDRVVPSAGGSMITRRQALQGLVGLALPIPRSRSASSTARVLLFLDEQSVASFDTITFHPNAAAKHPENPVLLPGEPHQWDSLQVTWPATVLYSPREGMFRFWYSGLDVIQSPGRVWKPGYAESVDGLHWIKPNLGQVEFLGKPTNQIDGPGRVLSAVFENPFPGA